MPSDKCNSITAKAMGLLFSYFVLHSFLHCHIGDYLPARLGQVQC